MAAGDAGAKVWSGCVPGSKGPDEPDSVQCASMPAVVQEVAFGTGSIDIAWMAQNAETPAATIPLYPLRPQAILCHYQPDLSTLLVLALGDSMVPLTCLTHGSEFPPTERVA